MASGQENSLPKWRLQFNPPTFEAETRNSVQWRSKANPGGPLND